MVTEFSELIKKKSLPPYTNNSRIRQKFRQISHLTLPPPLPLPIHYSRRSNRGAKHGARVRKKEGEGEGETRSLSPSEEERSAMAVATARI